MANEKIYISIGIFFIFIIIGGMAFTEFYTGGVISFELTDTEISNENLPSDMKILNIGSVNFESNNPDINGEAFVMNVIQDGSSDYAKGIKLSKDIETKDSTSRVAEENIIITSTINDYRCNYDITNDIEYSYKYRQIFMCYNDKLGWDDSCGGFLDPATEAELDARCKSVAVEHGSDYWKFVTYPEGIARDESYCVIRNTEATSGKISSPGFQMSSTFNIDIGENQYNLKMGFDDVTRQNIISDSTYNKEVMIYYTGNLINMGTKQCPQIEDNKKWKAIKIADKWRLVPLSPYNAYILTHPATLENCINFEMYKDDSQRENVQKCIVEINDYADKVSVPIIISEDTARVDTVSTNLGQINYFPSTLNEFPSYQLVVKADILNLVRNSGMPEITSIQMYDIKAGTQKEMKVSVKNIGAVSSSFYVTGFCNNGITISGSDTISSIIPGFSDIATLNIIAPANIFTSELLSECTITASDISDSTLKDISTVQFNILQDVKCIIDTTRCIGLEAEICTGISWELSPEYDVLCEEAFICDDTKPDTKCENEIKYECYTNTWFPDYDSTECVGIKDCYVIGTTKCEGDIEYVCTNYKWIPTGSIECITPGYCMTNEQCDDDNPWTVDSCEKTLLQKTFNQKGQCNNLDMLPFVVIGGIVLLIIGIIAIGGAFAIKKR